MNKIYCNDVCQKEFKLTQLNTNLVDQLSSGIDRFYLECPHCQQQYTSYFLDGDMKKIQGEILRLQNKHSLKIKQKNKLSKLRQRIKFKNNQLKMKYEQSELDNDDKKTY